MSEKLKIKSRLKDYEVEFIDNFEEIIIEKHKKDTSFFIVDEALINLYKEPFNNIQSDYNVLPVKAIEQNKTLEHCQAIIKNLIQERIRKNCTLIAIGGGIIQDITAFISSILFRGIEWIFYPTTLLAQADSCIGSKASINLDEFKNLLGGFYPPSHIYIDMKFLETLNVNDIKSGIGEMLHFYFYAGSNLTSELMSRFDELIDSPTNLKKYMLESLKIKKSVIEIDEFDKEIRNLFNYGHTFGHAIESVTGYAISHGQAVTMGMDIANYISLKLGYLDNKDFISMHEILSKNIPMFNLTNEMAEPYFSALSKDKKNIGKNLGCILSKGPGKLEKVQIPFDVKLKNIILSYFETKA